jgi:hypothetical protein
MVRRAGSKPLNDAGAERAIQQFARRLRTLAPGGKIPTEWKRRLFEALANRRGANVGKLAYRSARLELERRLAALDGLPPVRQEALAQALNIAPSTLRENFERHWVEALADSAFEEWLEEENKRG